MTLTTKYSVRLTHGSADGTNNYFFRPMLSHFDDQVGDFWKFFQFYRMNRIKISLSNCMNVSANNGSTIYQLPFVVVVPVRNGDLPVNLQYAMAYKGAKCAILGSEPMSMQMKPYV